jgi:predicted dehydrogenase
MTFFTESKVVSAHFEGLSGNERVRKTDNVSMLLKYEDGSIAHIDYFGTGSKQLSKEYLEIHFDDQSLVMDDYKSLKGYGVKLKAIQSSISEKGQKEELNFLYKTLKEGGPWPIALWDMIQTTEITFEAVKE